MVETTGWTTREGTPADASAIAAIYNEGIADRIATFETESRTPAEVSAWFKPRHLIVVVESDADGPVALAGSFPYSPRPLKGLGFEEIGIHRRHGQLDGCRRDRVIVERLLNMGAGEGQQ